MSIIKGGFKFKVQHCVDSVAIDQQGARNHDFLKPRPAQSVQSADVFNHSSFLTIGVTLYESANVCKLVSLN